MLRPAPNGSAASATSRACRGSAQRNRGALKRAVAGVYLWHDYRVGVRLGTWWESRLREAKGRACERELDSEAPQFLCLARSGWPVLLWSLSRKTVVRKLHTRLCASTSYGVTVPGVRKAIVIWCCTFDALILSSHPGCAWSQGRRFPGPHPSCTT